MSSTIDARRVLALFVASALFVAGLVATTRIAQAQSAPDEQQLDNLERIDAGTFVAAGVEVSERLFAENGAAAAVLATDANYPDALGASAVSGKVGGPVLFSPRDALAEATRTELRRVLPDGATVYFMGGVDALSQQVEDTVTSDGFGVVRLQGPTRFETAVAAGRFVEPPAGRVLLARAFGPPDGGPMTDQNTGWVDAIGCGGFAADRKTPILLSDTESLPSSTLQGLADMDATTVTICGGEAAISLETEEQLRQAGYTTDRVAGPNRVETALEVARVLWGYTTSADHNYIIINGFGPRFGFGLAATPLSAALDAPILLVNDGQPTACDPAFVSAPTFCYLETANSDNLATLAVVGDEAQVTSDVARALAEAAGGQPVEPTPSPSPSSSPRPSPSSSPSPRPSPSPSPSSSPSPEPSASPTPTPTEENTGPPPPPSQVSAVDETNDDGTRLTARWSGVDGADGYNVFVNGMRQGDNNPTVTGDTTSFEINGLQAGTAYEIRVSTVRNGREGNPSGPASATPADEAPPAPVPLIAVPGNSVVDLSWPAVEVPDLRDYGLSRATVAADADDCEAAGEFREIFRGDMTSFSDVEAENDMNYCYRIVSTDDRDQTSPEPTQAGPVMPSTGAPSVTFVAPSDDDLDPTSQPEFHGTGPLEVTYRVTDINTQVQDLRILIEYSLDDGDSYEVKPLFDKLHGTTETERTIIFRTPDVDSDEVRIRVTAIDPELSADSQRSDRLSFTRTPSRLRGLAALGGNEQVVLAWEPNPERAVDGYQIRRAEITSQTDTLDPSQCSAVPSNQFMDLARTEGRFETTFIDTAVDNGDFFQDTMYCYRVFATRPADDPDGPSALDDANPSGVNIAVDLTRPSQGETIISGTVFEIRFTVARPEGAPAPDRTRLEYCVDFRAPAPLFRASCQDEDGFKLIGDVNTDAPGNFTFDWNVPRTGQGDDVEGAIRARVNPDGENGAAATDVVRDITFR